LETLRPFIEGRTAEFKRQTLRYLPTRTGDCPLLSAYWLLKGEDMIEELEREFEELKRRAVELRSFL
jgi:hypothetical protein